MFGGYAEAVVILYDFSWFVEIGFVTADGGGVHEPVEVWKFASLETEGVTIGLSLAILSTGAIIEEAILKESG